jgi:predicted helicase
VRHGSCLGDLKGDEGIVRVVYCLSREAKLEIIAVVENDEFSNDVKNANNLSSKSWICTVSRSVYAKYKKGSTALNGSPVA